MPRDGRFGASVPRICATTWAWHTTGAQLEDVIHHPGVADYSFAARPPDVASSRGPSPTSPGQIFGCGASAFRQPTRAAPIGQPPGSTAEADDLVKRGPRRRSALARWSMLRAERRRRPAVSDLPAPSGLGKVIAVEWPGFSGLRPAASRYALAIWRSKALPHASSCGLLSGFPGGGAGPKASAP